MSFKEEVLEITNAKPTGSSGSYVGHCIGHEDKNPSLSITFVEGKDNPLLKCHSGCSGESLVNEFKNQGLWCITNDKKNEVEQNKESATSNKYLLALYNESEEYEGTIAEEYIEHRGVKPFENQKLGGVRFHKSVYYSKGQYYPCLLGVITNELQEVQGLQRIFLTLDSKKLNVKDNKKIIGRVSGGFTPISGEISDKIHICEGIETGIAIRDAIGESVLCAINAGNLSKIKIDSFSRDFKVHIWADNDKSGTGKKQAEIALTEYTSLGFDTYIHYPSKAPQNGQKSYDFLDQYVELGKKSIQESLSSPQKSNCILPIKAPFYKLPYVDSSFVDESIWNWGALNAEKLNIPIELIIVPLISFIGGLIGNKISVTPKRNDLSFKVYPNIWSIIIANPGSKKSPAMKQSYKFLEDYENREILKQQREIKKNKAKILAIKTQEGMLNSNYKKTIKNEEGGITEEAYINGMADLEKQKKELIPNIDRRIINSATIEKIIDLLQHSDSGFIVFRDELSALFDQFNKKGHENDRQFYLESWSGDGSHHYDTISRGTTYIEKLCLTLVGSTQPSIIKRVLDSANSGNDDGLLQRFQMMVYPNEIKNPRFVDIKYSSEHDSEIKKIIEEIIQIENENRTSKLSDDAYKLYSQYFDKLEKEIAEVESNLFKSHLCKYNKLTPGLALIFHIITQSRMDKPDFYSRISGESMQRAIQWTDLLKEHARKVYNLDYSFQNVSAFALAQKIISKKVKSGDSIRSIYKNEWKDLKSRDEVIVAADYLEEHNWLKVDDGKGQNVGRRSPKLILNDKLDEFLACNNWKS